MIVKEGRYFFTHISKFVNVRFAFHIDGYTVLSGSTLHMHPTKLYELLEMGTLLKDSELVRLLYGTK